MKTEFFLPKEISLLISKTNFSLTSMTKIEEEDDTFFQFHMVNADGTVRLQIKYAKYLNAINISRKNYSCSFCSRLVSLYISKETDNSKASFLLDNKSYLENQDVVSTVTNILKGIQ